MRWFRLTSGDSQRAASPTQQMKAQRWRLQREGVWVDLVQGSHAESPYSDRLAGASLPLREAYYQRMEMGKTTRFGGQDEADAYPPGLVAIPNRASADTALKMRLLRKLRRHNRHRLGCWTMIEARRSPTLHGAMPGAANQRAGEGLRGTLPLFDCEFRSGLADLSPLASAQ